MAAVLTASLFHSVELSKIQNMPAKSLSPRNRSLERGVDVLRAFRPGSALLGNAELAERTGLPRSTVSRLTQTLVGTGLLQVDPATRAYRLAPAVLTLAHAMRAGSQVLALASPLMRGTAQAHKINVGLAAPDHDEMVYLESHRYHPRPSQRSVVSGQRVPMALTSLGRAYLAVAAPAEVKSRLQRWRKARGPQWASLQTGIEQAGRDVTLHGYCAASWQHEVVALASPFQHQGADYVLNVSVSTVKPLRLMAQELAPILLALKLQIVQALAHSQAQ